MITSRANAVIVLGTVGAATAPAPEEVDVDDEPATVEGGWGCADGEADGHSLGTGGAERFFEGDLTESLADAAPEDAVADAALDLDEFEFVLELGFELELGDCCL